MPKSKFDEKNKTTVIENIMKMLSKLPPKRESSCVKAKFRRIEVLGVITFGIVRMRLVLYDRV